jgi:hypothetical protein
VGAIEHMIRRLRPQPHPDATGCAPSLKAPRQRAMYATGGSGRGNASKAVLVR